MTADDEQALSRASAPADVTDPDRTANVRFSLATLTDYEVGCLLAASVRSRAAWAKGRGWGDVSYADIDAAFTQEAATRLQRSDGEQR